MCVNPQMSSFIYQVNELCLQWYNQCNTWAQKGQSWVSCFVTWLRGFRNKRVRKKTYKITIKYINTKAEWMLFFMLIILNSDPTMQMSQQLRNWDTSNQATIPQFLPDTSSILLLVSSWASRFNMLCEVLFCVLWL